MKYTESDDTNKTNTSSGFISYIVIALLTLVIIILLAVFFFSPETITKFTQNSIRSSNSQQTDASTKNSTGSQSSSDQSIQLSDTDPSKLDGLASNSSDQSGVDTTSATDDDTQSQGTFNHGQASSKESCSRLAGNIESFFSTLDEKDYIKAFQLEASSLVYFSNLIQKLIDNPPVVSGETDDLFTILQNTAHFFRIIGKKNIFFLKGILDRERDTFEQTLADFYLLTDDPACLKDHFDLTIGQEELYAYAGFFLNTMGGRLYLFRRDSMSRMVVSFYAILIVDQANSEGRNKYGIEITDAIDNLIIEVESSRIQLKMRDAYLDTLYDLMVKYQ